MQQIIFSFHFHLAQHVSDLYGHIDQVSCQFIVISVREAVKVEPERVKLKNLHC
jgi:hypothetical protein